jgi:yersiniabactin nonribosomal peptide synthetase
LEVFYQLSPELSPSNLLKIVPLYDETIDSIISCIEKIASGCSGKIKVLELNTRDTAITEKILEKLKNNEVEYIYSDSSQYFTGIAKKELAEYENVSYQLLDIDSNITQQGTDIHEYDIIISVGAMHRVHDLDKAIENVSKLLAPNGVFIMSDITAETSLQNVSAALLEKGFSDITDERKLSGKLLPDTELWRKMIGKSGLSRSFAVKEYPAFALIISQQQEKVAVYDESRLKEYLSGKLPEYMIPKKYCFMEQLPMLSNGKLNRKVLKQLVNENNTRIKNEILSDTEKALIDIWKDIFGFDNISAEDNYFNLGGDSLIATKLISQIQKKFGCKLSIAAVFENLTVRLLAKAVENAEKTYDDSIAVEADTEHRFEAFPLTDVQYAYWIGRSGLYQLGNCMEQADIPSRYDASYNTA